MCAEVASRSEVFEVGGESGDTLSFTLNEIVKSVPFGNNKFLRSEVAFENGCKIIVSFPRRSFWRAHVREDIVDFGTDDRDQCCSGFESFGRVRWNTVRDKMLLQTLQITILILVEAGSNSSIFPKLGMIPSSSPNTLCLRVRRVHKLNTHRR